MRVFFTKGIVLTGFLILVGGVLNSALAVEEKKIRRNAVPELRLNLRMAMQTSIEQNPTVQISRQRVKESKAASITQLGTMLPNLSGNSELGESPILSRKFRGDSGCFRGF